MAIQVYKAGEAPKATRRKRRTLEGTEEWMSLRAKLADGIGQNEEIAVTFTPAEKAKFKLKTLKRVFRDMSKSYIKRMHLPYSVEAYTSDGGTEVILIRNEMVLAGRGGAREEAVTERVERPTKKRRRA